MYSFDISTREHTRPDKLKLFTALAVTHPHSYLKQHLTPVALFILIMNAESEHHHEKVISKDWKKPVDCCPLIKYVMLGHKQTRCTFESGRLSLDIYQHSKLF